MIAENEILSKVIFETNRVTFEHSGKRILCKYYSKNIVLATGQGNNPVEATKDLLKNLGFECL